MVLFGVNYLGTTVVDKRFSSPMVPWVIADVKRRKKVQKVSLVIKNGEIKGLNEKNVNIFRHQLQNVTRFCHEPNNMRIFMYLVRDDFDPVLHCFIYQAVEFEDVVEIFQAMRENTRENSTGHHIPTKSHSSAASLTSLCSDISPSNSQFFEVLYVGRIKVSRKKVPETFIDDAVEKIKLHELEKSKKLHEQTNEYQKSKSLEMGSKISNKNGGGIVAPVSGSDKCDSAVADTKNAECHPCTNAENSECATLKALGEVETTLKEDVQPTAGSNVCDITNKDCVNEKKNVMSSDDTVAGKSEAEAEKLLLEMGCKRNRTGSMGVIESYRKKTGDDSSHNRTMLFYVGRTDLRLISPDRKQVLLCKMLKDVTSCIQGVQNSEHFGFISRETDCFIGYVFKCESDSIAEDVVSAITQSFHATKELKEHKQPVLSCEHCPMLWFHKLCAEIEGLNEKKTQMAILKKIESLPDEEQDIIHTKFQGAESSDIKEMNEFLMILLRAHCETKQTRHVHDTAENRSEFLNQYLGGNTIFMKAKRSFDQLLKRKNSHLEVTPSNSKESLSRKSDSSLNDSDGCTRQKSPSFSSSEEEIVNREMRKQIHDNQNEAEQLKRQFQKEKSVESDTKSQGKKPSFPEIAALAVNNQKIEKTYLQNAIDAEDASENDTQKTPMINIFLKVGSANKTPPSDKFIPDEMNLTPSGSWRQAIFNRVVTNKQDEKDELCTRRRTKSELRDLWRKAINQQLLLIRMEKENARLRARQEEATVKRIKLEYDELCASSKEYMGIWDLISNKDNRINSSKCDSQMLLQAIRQGVPRAKRGDVWHFLAVQYCLKQPPFDTSGFPNYDVYYEDLLKQLTSFQHAILIDLGRTFPNHPYFASPLGPGQLALFNLLKAYSLLDPQVGYCQGLSFVAGVLLLHMSEETAFLLLRHLMFRRGLRKQYLPDMAALQVQLYQLSRLLHDTIPKLYAHFDKNEIAPTLYAAPWILTLFASQFPLGFVTRVFDLLFLEHTTDIIFRVIMSLLEEHKESLLSRSTFEEIMDYLKNDLPKMDSARLERIMKKVLTMDIGKHLHEYEVEYHVLQEEMYTPRPEVDQLKRMEVENRRLTEQISTLKAVNKNQNSEIRKLETKVLNLEITIAMLGDFIADIGKEYRDIEIPGDIRRIISNLELAEQRSSKQMRNEQNSKKKFDKSAFLKRSKTSMGFYEKTDYPQPQMEELYSVSDLPQGTKFGDIPSKEETSNEPVKGPQPKPIAPRGLPGVPLKVIVDEDDDDKKRMHHNAPNLTSKLTSGVSSFFNSSHNQIIKNQKNKKFFQDNLFVNNGKTNEAFTDDAEQTCRKFSKEIGSLNIKESIINNPKKDKTSNAKENKVVKIDLNQTSDTGNNGENATSRIHPLDTCNDVNITYNGTTKLKCLKPGHRFNRNNTIDLIPIRSNDFLRIDEDFSDSKEEKHVISQKILKICDSDTQKF